MNREQFLARKSKTKDVTMPDENVVTVRKLSESEVETLKKKYGSEDRALEARRFIVCKCLVDDERNRIFTDEDLTKPVITEMDFDDVNTIATEVIDFSGLNKTAKKA